MDEEPDTPALKAEGELEAEGDDEPESLEEGEESDEDGNTIYLGFGKGDYDRSVGRKGRTIKDDPSRYPNRSTLTGGWSGGEAGLKKFIQVRFGNRPQATFQRP